MGIENTVFQRFADAINELFKNYVSINLEKSKNKSVDYYFINVISIGNCWHLNSLTKTIAKIYPASPKGIYFNGSNKKYLDSYGLHYTLIPETFECKVDFEELDKISQTRFQSFVYLITTNCFSFPSFGCCGKFKECQDLGFCIHDDQLYATACQYQKLLKGVHNETV